MQGEAPLSLSLSPPLLFFTRTRARITAGEVAAVDSRYPSLLWKSGVSSARRRCRTPRKSPAAVDVFIVASL
jgi:hypothetical protein